MSLCLLTSLPTSPQKGLERQEPTGQSTGGGQPAGGGDRIRGEPGLGRAGGAAVSCVVRAGAALPPKPQSIRTAGLSPPFKYESIAEGTRRLKEASTVTENEIPKTIMRRPAGVPGGQSGAGGCPVPSAEIWSVQPAEGAQIPALWQWRRGTMGGLWLCLVSAGGPEVIRIMRVGKGAQTVPLTDRNRPEETDKRKGHI